MFCACFLLVVHRSIVLCLYYPLVQLVSLCVRVLSAGLIDPSPAYLSHSFWPVFPSFSLPLFLPFCSLQIPTYDSSRLLPPPSLSLSPQGTVITCWYLWGLQPINSFTLSIYIAFKPSCQQHLLAIAFQTKSTSGIDFQLDLMWVPILAVMIAIVLQEGSSRLVVDSNKNLVWLGLG